MATASGIRTLLGLVAETTIGVTPATPTLQLLRPTSRNINLAKNLMESAEVASHGQEVDVRHGFNRVEGTIGGEMLTGAWDLLIEAAMGGTWATAGTANAVAATITAPATVAGVGTSNGIKVGDAIRLAGFSNAANNGTFIVLTAGASTVTVAVPASQPLVTGSGGTATSTGKRSEIGLVQKSFTIERQFPDIGVYEQFLGVTTSSLAVNITPEQIPTLTFNMLGLKSATATASSIGTNAAAATGYTYSSFDGAVMFNGAVAGAVVGMDFNINQNRNLQPVVGSKFSPDVYEGRRQITGSMSVMFESAAIYNAFVNETPVPVGVVLNDPDGVNWQSIYMPRTKLTGAPADPGQTGPVLRQCSFRALYDTTRLTSLAWHRSNVA